MKRICSLFLFLALTATAMASASADPANPNANAKARAILSYFQSLASARTNRILSGQFTDAGPRASLKLLENIQSQTGHWPALMGADYANYGRGSLTSKEPNQAAIDYWKQGGLVTISAHLYNPANTNGGGLRDKGVDLNTLLDPNSDTHKRWMNELDTIATGLQQLKDAGVVVLWRPFHEMNGGWFWWGDKDPETFKKVWQHMFHYFTTTKKLDNLLWVYSPNHGKNTAAYYAGDNYVDLVGLDAYTDFVDKQHIHGYDEVAELPKPFGFTEYGPHGSEKPPGDYDYRRFIAGVEKDFPKTCFFMCWNWKWSLAMNNNTKELLDNPAIANRENIPAQLTGTGK